MRHTSTHLPDLGDTRTAFAGRSDGDLRRAAWMFRVIGNPLLMAIGWRLTRAALALRFPVKGLVKATVFRQFCGGETIGESLGVAARLAVSGIGTILDHGVEGQDEEAALDATVEEVLRTIAVARGMPARFPFCVFKPTGISRTRLLEDVGAGKALSPGEEEEWGRVRDRMERLCRAAYDAGVPLLVDAEESWLQPAIDGLVEAMMARYNRDRAIVYNTVQLYRHDRLAFLKESHARAVAGGYHLGMKLVRGAYMEKERERAAELGHPSPVHADKAATDRDYDAAIAFCLDHVEPASGGPPRSPEGSTSALSAGGGIAFMAGTHNEDSTLLLARSMAERGMAPNDARIGFGQLLGMSDHISYNLAAAGFNTAKYVPYGPVREMLPYLVRRAEENTSTAGLTARELALVKAELARRAKGR